MVEPTLSQEELARKISEIVERYLAEKISLGKAAELLHLSRFELMDHFQRLGIPLRIGPATLEEARAEVATALKYGSILGDEEPVHLSPVPSAREPG